MNGHLQLVRQMAKKVKDPDNMGAKDLASLSDEEASLLDSTSNNLKVLDLLQVELEITEEDGKISYYKTKKDFESFTVPALTCLVEVASNFLTSGPVTFKK